MLIRFTDLTGSLEAAFDGYSRVIIRQKGTIGPNFHPVSRAETPSFREGRKRGSLVVVPRTV